MCSRPRGRRRPRIAADAPPLKVVTSLTTYGAIAREILGDHGTVTSIAQGDEDPHFVQPKPSFVAVLRNADLFVTTGLDLELWVPPLLDRAGNRKVSEGGPGYVTAYTGIQLLEVPTSLSRSEGDIHADGNPHIHTDPVNGIIIARNILTGLRRVSPGDAAYFTQREQDFERRVLEATIGADLVNVLTAPVAYDLLKSDKLYDFLGPEAVPGQAAARPARRLDEDGGGVPGEGDRLLPQGVGLLQQPVQGDLRRVHRGQARHPADSGARAGGDRADEGAEDSACCSRRTISTGTRSARWPQRTGAQAVIVPENTNGAPGINTYFDLMSTWVNGLASAFKGGAS